MDADRDGGTNVTTHANIGLAAGTAYHYRVRAYNGGGDSAYSNVADASTLAPHAATILLPITLR